MSVHSFHAFTFSSFLQDWKCSVIITLLFTYAGESHKVVLREGRVDAEHTSTLGGEVSTRPSAQNKRVYKRRNGCTRDDR